MEIGPLTVESHPTPEDTKFLDAGVAVVISVPSGSMSACEDTGWGPNCSRQLSRKRKSVDVST